MPAIETWPGTSTPRSRSRISTPIAASSLAATIASGSRSRASSSVRGAQAVLVGEAAGDPVGPARALEALQPQRAGVQALRALDERDALVAEAA